MKYFEIVPLSNLKVFSSNRKFCGLNSMPLHWFPNLWFLNRIRSRYRSLKSADFSEIEYDRRVELNCIFGHVNLYNIQFEYLLTQNSKQLSRKIFVQFLLVVHYFQIQKSNGRMRSQCTTQELKSLQLKPNLSFDCEPNPLKM